MASAHTSHSSGGQAGFGLILAIAAFAISGFLFWSDARADTLAEPADPRAIDGLVRLSEMQEGALLIETVEPGYYLPAPMLATDMAVEIAGPIIRTTITQRFENPSDQWVEARYVFPLPANSGVDRLRMQVGDRFIEGQIHERQAARRIYEQARDNGQRASLVEQERPNMFTTSVANIGPGETIIIQIEYQDVARLRDGTFEMRLPLGLTPRFIPRTDDYLLVSETNPSPAVPDAHRITPPVMAPSSEPGDRLRLPVTISAQLRPGFELGEITSLYHATRIDRSEPDIAQIELADGPIPANRDFVLTWRPANETAPSASLFTEDWEGETYLLAQILPPATLNADAPRRPRETIFVIDNSGSMAGTSMRQARDALLAALDRLQPEDRFNIIRFDNTMEQVFPAPVEASDGRLRQARRFVRNLDAEGGTNMLPAMRAALTDDTPEDTSRVRQVVFLTDGAIGNERELFREIHNRLGRSRLFPVGIGSAPNTYFMERAARAGRGTFTHIGDVSEVSERMAQLYTALERPVMTHLDALFAEGTLSEIWPAPLPDLYYGEPVLMTARLSDPDGMLLLEGRLAQSGWQTRLDLAEAQPAEGIAALWARNRIKGIEETRFQGAPADRIDAAVLQTALDFHLVSRLTSLVAVDVTPARPADQPLNSQDIAQMTPHGWDFDAVTRNTSPVDHAALDPELLRRLRVHASPEEAALAAENGLPLPATATPRELLTWLGALLMLAGLIFLMMNRERRLW
ncbi:marine proteobacterial sortase target protein [Maricaulis alexandrii]|uniref:marine proteobacterial sortase target protein n=1 Tax=Maricaulis alexandrii TaxID=2570354 RepID=UPI001107E99E|nr:marine proteobacterial sortase target protein [Maricaulis alexandrii]